MTLRYAVIADIVGSRTLTNRAEAQGIFEAALADASEGLALLQAPYLTRRSVTNSRLWPTHWRMRFF